LTSCFSSDNYYYGKFGKQYSFFYFNPKKNKVIQVDIPETIMIKWGEEVGISSSAECLYSFTGYPKKGILIGTTENKVYFDSILDALCRQNGISDNPTSADRLKVFVENAGLFRKKAPKERLISFFGEDIEKVLEIMDKYNPESEYYNAGDFLIDTTDIRQVKRYFGIWIQQVIGG